MTHTVTVAIPLHCSLPWVDNVVANVRALPELVTEILVSDRTCLDDAAQRLEVLLADDHRVRIIAEPTGLGWEEHYQELLEGATGDLFMWMPHDDIFEPTWVPVLAAALDAHPEAWLAYGRMECVLGDGVTPHWWIPQVPARGPIRGWDVLEMGLWGEGGVPFRGVFRRQPVLASGIRLEKVSRFAAVDILWVVAVGLRSALVFDERTLTIKRYHSDSAHASWSVDAAEREDAVLALTRWPRGRRGRKLRKQGRAAVHRRRLSG